MIAIIIACHNKIDDLVLHLESLKYFTFPHEVIIIHTMDYEEKYMKEIEKYHHKKINGYGHYIGPLLCAIEGIREAHKLGCEYAVYRNSDDILYGFEWEENNFKMMEDKKYLCAGYNWLNVGVYHDITLNQLYFHVPSFYKTADDAEAYFKRSDADYLCEYKIPRWIKKTCPKLNEQFYRLPGREQEPGIGWERKDLYNAFHSKGLTIPIGFWEKLENNNRFFNLEWRMIGSHDIGSRLIYWRKIRGLLPYRKQIEKDFHHSRFIEAVRNNLPWNLPAGKTIHMPKITQVKSPKLISRRIF